MHNVLILHQSSCFYSVVLVGHSLGGLIGKALFTLPGFPAAQVSSVKQEMTTM